MTTTLSVDGMGCEGCEEIVENALTGVNGVEDASADRDDGAATVEGGAGTSELLEAVEYAGYEAELAD